MINQWESTKAMLQNIEDGWMNSHNVPKTFKNVEGLLTHLRKGYTVSILGSSFVKKKTDFKKDTSTFSDFKCTGTGCLAVLRIHDLHKIRSVFLSVLQSSNLKNAQIKPITATVELLKSHTCLWVLAQSRGLSFFNQLRQFNGLLNSWTGIYAHNNMHDDKRAPPTIVLDGIEIE